MTYTTLVTSGTLPGGPGVSPDQARDLVFQPAFVADADQSGERGGAGGAQERPARLNGQAPTDPASAAFAIYYANYHGTYEPPLCHAQARALFNTVR